MKVKVCDALCGAGKTVSCINMINSSIDKKYIFITPYLDEVERIQTNCADKHFVTPQKKADNGYSKLNDLPSLLRAGKNIASTHALFSCYTDEIKDLIREQKYTLILDEVIDLFQPVNMNSGDVEFLVRNNIAKKDGENILWDDDEYQGVAFEEIMQYAKSKNLVDYDGSFFFWSLPVDVFKCFEDAYVLTYLFEYQMMKYYFDANDVDYELIGTKRENDVYQFCPLCEMDRKVELRDKIHIVMDEKYNNIGNENYSLSSTWFERAKREPKQPKINILKNNLYNIFRHKNGGKNIKMWTTIKKYRSSLKGKGYSNDFMSFNMRAVNGYANKNCLAYCVNVYLQPWMKNYLTKIGNKNVNQDMYALSVLVQWVFRSAIRKGEEIWIYIPSKRMRTLFIKWLNNLAEGKDLKPINFSYIKEKKINEAVFKLQSQKNGGSKNV